MPALGSWRQAASACGFTIDPVLREVGINPHDPQVPLRVTPANLFKAFSMCVERARGHHFPFALGENFVFEHFTEFDAFIDSCSTIREILELAGWARELLTPWMALRLDEFGAEAHIRVVMTVPDQDPAELCHVREVLLAAIHQLLRRASHNAHILLSVRMAGPVPAHPEKYAEHFGVPVSFNEETDALVMDRRWLDQPLNAPPPQALTEARQRIERRLNQEGAERHIVDEVRWALERRPELLREGLEATAVALGLHPRTLQRRLQAEGVKYVDIQSEAKCHRAQIMLRRRAISMESISEELGFSDRRAFTFAFKRWMGVSPSVYRSRLSSGHGVALSA
ncbi:MAG: AraC family transcriptional regulator ligand-binding domain-containing protein [Proteobacteria bacterium]|uniref:AraC family transcriptional regulator n=1 Tax=Aquabacterium sp. TaxID=1872578 RepID=UPI0035C7389A|nr:AraC family transcriptional regulator ligand-binding domain-containing protein [Pseudomonadota bacterium]